LKKSILEVYAMAVCFVCVLCFVVSAGLAMYGLVGMANPEFTMSSWTYGQHQTNDAFVAGPPEFPRIGEGEQRRERPPEAELTQKRVDSFARAIASERRASAQTVVKTVIVMLIDLLVFLFHWYVGRRARESAA
jgi:hypothetical protein